MDFPGFLISLNSSHEFRILKTIAWIKFLLLNENLIFKI